MSLCNGICKNDVCAGQAVTAAVTMELCSGGHWSGMRAVRHGSLSACTAAEHCYCLRAAASLIHTMLFTVSRE